MNFEILPIEKDDWPELVSISHRAWADEPIWNLLYPQLDTPEGQAQAVVRLSRSFDQIPQMKWIKVVERETRSIAGAALWIFFPDDPYSPDKAGKGMNRVTKAEWLGDEDDPTRQFFEWFYNGKRDRRKEFNEFLKAHTYPKYQRQGAASAALQWGLSRTDEMGLPCLLEATRMGYDAGIYHRHGFYDLASMEFNDGRPLERRSRLSSSWHMCMVRPAKGEERPKRRDDQVHTFT